ncbi:MAG TPA: hypothetical protein VGF08_08780, partial [Terriglobales bacterium]
DLAQVRAVIEDERTMWKNCRQALGLLRMNFGSLFWLYFRISLVSWLVGAAGLWLWSHMPGQLSGLSFAILEVVLFWWVLVRLWQRAAEVTWYQRQVVSQLAVAQPGGISAPIPIPLDMFPANS